MVVNLKVAYEWDCPKCYHNQFARSGPTDFSEEMEQHLRDMMGIDDPDTEIVSIPKKVTCEMCIETFATRQGYEGDVQGLH